MSFEDIDVLKLVVEVVVVWVEKVDCKVYKVEKVLCKLCCVGVGKFCCKKVKVIFNKCWVKVEKVDCKVCKVCCWLDKVEYSIDNC